MLKKTGLILIFTLILVFTTSAMAQARSYDKSSDVYTYFGLGYKDPFWNLSCGLRFAGNFGVEFGVGVRQYPGILDYPCPHSYYTIIDDNYKAVLLGFDLIHYTDIGEKVTLYAGAGLYVVGYDTVVESNSTYWVYRQYTTYEGKFAYSGGIQIHENIIGIGLGYHSLRGVNLQMVFKM